MTNRKRLWYIFGPVILAFVLILILFTMPLGSHYSAKTEQRAASSLSPVVFKNQKLKQQALSDKNTRYVPFFGSSELRRFDNFHPSIMAARYHNYTPFLLGQRGAQSLPQFFNITTMEGQLRDKKAVYIVSPQWFVKKGILPPAFKYYNGELADLTWLKKANPKSPYDQYVAKRLIQMIGNDGSVAEDAAKIAQGKPLSSWDKAILSFRLTLLQHQDALFSGIQLDNNYSHFIKPQIHKLPAKYNEDRLHKMAVNEAAKETDNNDFHVKNSFYTKKVKPNLKKLKGSQRHFNYNQSPEYGDLQVVLNQFKNNNTNVMFVIPPVNGQWEAFTGMDMQMYYRTVNKIKFQLRQQGFNNILDLSHDGNKPYFMEDTIHIGYAGWVKFDSATSKFIEQSQPQPHYHLSDEFLTKTWANLIPTQQNLNQFKEQKLNK